MHPGSSCIIIYNVMYSCHCGVLLTVFTDGVLKPLSLNFPFNLVAVFPIKPHRTGIGQVLSSIITQISTCNNYSCINNETLVTSLHCIDKRSCMYFSYAMLRKKWSTNFEALNLLN